MLGIIRVTAHNHKSETMCTSTSATLMCFVCPGVMVVSNEIPVRIVRDVVVVVGFFGGGFNRFCQAVRRIKMAHAGQEGSHPMHLPGADCK